MQESTECKWLNPLYNLCISPPYADRTYHETKFSCGRDHQTHISYVIYTRASIKRMLFENLHVNDFQYYPCVEVFFESRKGQRLHSLIFDGADLSLWQIFRSLFVAFSSEAPAFNVHSLPLQEMNKRILSKSFAFKKRPQNQHCLL